MAYRARRSPELSHLMRERNSWKRTIMIPTQPFGRTGHSSTRAIFRAAAFSDVTQEEADSTIELLLRHGVSHMDTAASYGDSELRRLATERETSPLFV